MSRLDSIDSAIKDLRKGGMVVVVDDEGRENEGDLVLAAQKATAESVNFMAKEARGLVCVPITKGKADQLGLPKMTWQSDNFQTPFTVSVDAAAAGTGISIADRLLTIKTIAGDKSRPESLRRPGHIFPLVAQEGGVLTRAGHTEASVDLMLLAGLKPVAVICEIMNPDGSMARFKQLRKFADENKLKMVSIKDLIGYKISKGKNVMCVAQTSLPTSFGMFKAFGYLDLVAKHEYLVLVKGKISKKTPLVRIHSGCLTGDVFHSKRCDCNGQLHCALKAINRYGCGVLIYAQHQEGRGIGLLNKLKAYHLQDEGKDTVEANLELGFEADVRDFGPSAQILKDLGVKKLNLLSNNPEKKKELGKYGLKVLSLVKLNIKPNKHNRRYLETKKLKLGHSI